MSNIKIPKQCVICKHFNELMQIRYDFLHYRDIPMEPKIDYQAYLIEKKYNNIFQTSE